MLPIEIANIHIDKINQDGAYVICDICCKYEYSEHTSEKKRAERPLQPFDICGDSVEQVSRFCCHRSLTSDPNDDGNNWIRSAHQALVGLYHCVFSQHGLSVQTKIGVYRAVVISSSSPQSWESAEKNTSPTTLGRTSCTSSVIFHPPPNRPCTMSWLTAGLARCIPVLPVRLGLNEAVCPAPTGEQPTGWCVETKFFCAAVHSKSSPYCHVHILVLGFPVLQWQLMGKFWTLSFGI